MNSEIIVQSGTFLNGLYYSLRIIQDVIFAATFISSLGYILFWMLDYFEIIEENPIDSTPSNLNQWLQTFKYTDVAVFPLAAVRVIVKNLELNNYYGTEKQKF
jgi:hypothetical protein